jgi:hypothetical protein
MNLKSIIDSRLDEAFRPSAKRRVNPASVIKDDLVLKDDIIDKDILEHYSDVFYRNTSDSRSKTGSWWYFQIKAVLNVIAKNPTLTDAKKIVVKANEMITNSGFTSNKFMIERDNVIFSITYAMDDMKKSGVDFSKLKSMRKSDLLAIGGDKIAEAVKIANGILDRNMANILKNFEDTLRYEVLKDVESSQNREKVDVISSYDIGRIIERDMKSRNIKIRIESK